MGPDARPPRPAVGPRLSERPHERVRPGLRLSAVVPHEDLELRLLLVGRHAGRRADRGAGTGAVGLRIAGLRSRHEPGGLRPAGQAPARAGQPRGLSQLLRVDGARPEPGRLHHGALLSAHQARLRPVGRRVVEPPGRRPLIPDHARVPRRRHGGRPGDEAPAGAGLAGRAGFGHPVDPRPVRGLQRSRRPGLVQDPQGPARHLGDVRLRERPAVGENPGDEHRSAVRRLRPRWEPPPHRRDVAGHRAQPPPIVRGDTLWAVVKDAVGVQYVVRGTIRAAGGMPRAAGGT